MQFLRPIPLSPTLSFCLLLLRVVVGLAFMYHGWSKIQDPLAWMGTESSIPGVLQLLAAVSEFFGGLAWILGLLTPIASLGIIATMAVAVWMHMMVFGDPFVSSSGGSYELAAVYLVIAILLFFAGPGRYALDYLIFDRKSHHP